MPIAQRPPFTKGEGGRWSIGCLGGVQVGELKRVLRSIGRQGWRRRPCRWVRGRPTLYVIARLDWEVKVWYRPWVGLSAVALTRPGSREAAWLDDVMEFGRMKRRIVGAVPGAKDGPVHLAAIETNLLSTLHSIVKHLAVTKYEDGEPRTPGTMIVSTLGSNWKIVLKDPDTCSQLQVIQTNLDDALTLAGLLLDSDTTPWETDPWAKQRAKKK